MRFRLKILCTIGSILLWIGLQSSKSILVRAQSSDTGSNRKTSTTIKGVVRDGGTGAAIPEVSVSTYVKDQKRTTMTDAAGNFSFTDVPFGRYRLNAQRRNPHALASMLVSAPLGLETVHVDLKFPASASIAGTVVDEQGEGVERVGVVALKAQLHHGKVTYIEHASTMVDDMGRYRLEGLPAGTPILLRVGYPRNGLNARDDRKQRPTALVTTYYPGSQSIDGAAPIILQPDEQREGVKLLLLRRPTYCVQASVMDSNDRKSNLFVYDVSGGQKTQISGGPTDENKLKLCGFAAGHFEIVGLSTPTGNISDAPDHFGTADIWIAKEDIPDVQVVVGPGLKLAGRIRRADKTDTHKQPVRAQIELSPEGRLPFLNEKQNSSAQCEVPCDFVLPSVFAGKYRVSVSGLSNRGYVKQVLFDGNDVTLSELNVGQGRGDLQILVGDDGGILGGHLVDKDGDSVSGTVFIFRADIGSEQEFMQAVKTMETDQFGIFSTAGLAPGRYIVVGTGSKFDGNPEIIRRVWRSKSKAKELEITPNANRSETIECASLSG